MSPSYLLAFFIQFFRTVLPGCPCGKQTFPQGQCIGNFKGKPFIMSSRLFDWQAAKMIGDRIRWYASAPDQESDVSVYKGISDGCL